MSNNRDEATSVPDFDALLASVTLADATERQWLRTIADQCDIAHDACGLGVDRLQQGRYTEALKRLRIAVRHGLDDALPLVRHCERFAVLDNTAPVAAAATTAQGSGSPPLTSSGKGASVPCITAARDAEHSASMPGRTGAATVATESTTGEGTAATVLRASHESLAYGMTSCAPGTISALALTGGLMLGPGDGHRILFGRNRPEVHVCIGEDDRHVDRHQGTLEHGAGRWRLRNTGRLPLRIDHRLLFPDEDALVLEDGFTQIFIRGHNREHLLEVFVTGPDGNLPAPQHAEPTAPPRQWQLSGTERLVLVVLAQRYLLREPYPQPVSWRQAAAELAELQPDANWTQRRVEHVIAAVRVRLGREGVTGLTREEVGEPVGNSINHNLIKELLMTTSLVPRDLMLVDAS